MNDSGELLCAMRRSGEQVLRCSTVPTAFHLAALPGRGRVAHNDNLSAGKRCPPGPPIQGPGQVLGINAPHQPRPQPLASARARKPLPPLS